MKGTAALRRRILARRARLAVLGQGYVGLSLACAAAEAGFEVEGIDVDAARVASLRDRTAVPGVNEAAFRSAADTGRITFSTDAEGIARSELVFICVPTPVSDGAPDLSFIEAAALDVAANLSEGSLVVLESTTYPGTTEQRVLPLLESRGRMAGRDFLLAYSPERIDPGSREHAFRDVPRVVGGTTPEGAGIATLFYEQLVDKVVTVSSTRAAELAKLLENTFRHVNIALVNEMAVLCHDVGLDVWEVLDAAASKPFGFMRFEPGPGVGGHCIPVDPTYLTWQVRRDVERRFRIVEQAQEINGEMPAWVASRIGDALNDRGMAMKGARVLVLGVAYKPDVGDVRESPALKIIGHLHRRGARITFHDPYVAEIHANGSRFHRTELTNAAVAGADCVALLTPHRAYDLGWVAEHAALVFDARNGFADTRFANVVKL